MTGQPQRRPAPKEVVMQFHPSWKGMFGWYFKRMFLAALAVVLAVVLYRNDVIAVYWVALALIVTVGGVVGLGRLIRQSTTYRITTRGVEEISGILRKKNESALFDEITNTTVEAGLFERMLGVGKVDFDTAGELRFHADGRESDFLAWWGVPNPQGVADMCESIRVGDYNDYEDYAPELDPDAGPRPDEV